MRRSPRAVATVLFAASLLAACGDPAPRAPAAASAWDRDVARREVLAAALVHLVGKPDAGEGTHVVLVDDTLQPNHTYEEDYVPPRDRAANVVSLPDRRKVFRPQIETLATETFDDWVAQTAPIPAPRDLTLAPRIEWSSAADRKALARSRRSSTTFIELSDVGFSRSREQALLQGTEGGDSSTSGFWLLLERRDGRWAVAEYRRTFIACGMPSLVTTPVDR